MKSPFTILIDTRESGISRYSSPEFIEWELKTPKTKNTKSQINGWERKYFIHAFIWSLVFRQ